MNRLTSLTILLAAHTVALSALAAPDPLRDYRCVVQRADASHKGTFFDFMSAGTLGEMFTVERRSGVMAGVLKNNLVNAPKVIDLGNNGNGYKVVGILPPSQTGPGSNVSMLNVCSYCPGSKKPFVYLDDEVVYFGDCENF